MEFRPVPEPVVEPETDHPANYRAQVNGLRADVVEIVGLSVACATLGEFRERLEVLLAAGVADRVRPWPAQEGF